MAKKSNLKTGIIAGKLVAHMDKTVECWDILDRYRSNGTIKAPEPPTFKTNVRELSIPEIISLCLNLPSHLTKLRGKIKVLSDGPKKQELELKYKAKLREYEELKAWRDEGTQE